MKENIAIIFFLLSFVNGYTQSCDSLLQTNVDSSAAVFVAKLKSNIKCGTLDKFDIEYCSPYWGQFYAGSKTIYTYGDFYKDYENFKKTIAYINYRKEMYPQFEFQQLKMTSENWQKAKEFLMLNGIEKEILKEYQNFIKHYSESDTHGTAWKNFKKKILTKTKSRD